MNDLFYVSRTEVLDLLSKKGFALHSYSEDDISVRVTFGFYIKPEIDDTRPKVSFYWESDYLYKSFDEYLDLCKIVIK